MKTSVAIPDRSIPDFCRKWKVKQLWLFGSIVRDELRPDSDVDVMFEFAKDADRSLLARSNMKRELEQLFGRAVDLVERRTIECDPNYIRRRHILETAESAYGS